MPGLPPYECKENTIRRTKQTNELWEELIVREREPDSPAAPLEQRVFRQQ